MARPSLKMDELVLSPSDFVAIFNQTIEHAYPKVIIEGELSNFRVNRNRWVYFDVKDEVASIKFFGSVYQLPGPLEDGLMVQVVGTPRLHPQFGFSITFQSIQPVGRGSLKKAAELLMAKLAAEGLFAPERKRPLPRVPQRIGLITAATSAASADFMKIFNERWGGAEVLLADVLVQGQEAPLQIAAALAYFEQITPLADVLVITRGGGSAEDLAAFNDERVVRAVAGSRTPTLVAIGHEVDISLAELAADQRASTPSNAAQLLVPDRRHELAQLSDLSSNLKKDLLNRIQTVADNLAAQRKYLTSQVFSAIDQTIHQLRSTKKLVAVFDPRAALKRGYAIVSKKGKHISSVKNLSALDRLKLELQDGKIGVIVEGTND